MSHNYNYEYETTEYAPHYLTTNRSLLKFILLNLVTCGLYSIFFFIPFSYDIDEIYPKRDGTKTMNFFVVFVLSLFTFSIVMWVWHHHIGSRISEALEARRIDYKFGPRDFWLLYVLGSFLVIPPFVYMHKLCKSMNLLCEHYNVNPSNVAED